MILICPNGLTFSNQMFKVRLAFALRLWPVQPGVLMCSFVQAYAELSDVDHAVVSLRSRRRSSCTVKIPMVVHEQRMFRRLRRCGARLALAEFKDVASGAPSDAEVREQTRNL